MYLEQLKDKKLWGIFFLAMGTLLYEVTLTLIFSFVVWSNYAFMIVSTALFGFGIAGVALFAFSGFFERWSSDRLLGMLSCLFALSAVGSLPIIVVTPLDMGRFQDPMNWVYLLVVFMAIIVPFFFSGLAISILLSRERGKVNRLYFFDLLGAALGSLILIVLITPLGANGTLFVSALLGLVSSYIFLERNGGLKRLLLGLMIVTVVGVVFAERLITLYPHQNKRNFKRRLKMMKPLFSGWSTLSRIDVMGKKVRGGIRAQIWINGGQNQSFLAVLKPQHLSRPNWNESINYPYIFMRNKRPTVLIIGSSGGTEVVYALSHRSRLVDAVEMDPLICKLVKHDFREFNHDLFNRKDVRLINDEGRSFVLNGVKKYDLIQMRNNFTPIAIASGAINLSETYLLTVEGMKNYIEDLKEDGILALNRWGSIRLCTTLRQAFEEMGRKDVWKHVVVMTGETWMLNGFYFKNSPFTAKEVAWTKEFARVKHLKILYHPEMAEETNLYSKVLKGKSPERFYRYAGFDLTPPTDERPFFNHFLTTGVGHIDLRDTLIPSELKRIYELFAWRPFKASDLIVSKSDLPVISLGIEAIVVSLLFIFLPLKLKGKDGKGKWPFFLYFSILGMGFIMIELCLIKQFTLFLGIPSVSISLVIALLLFFSGLGSFVAERFVGRERKALQIILPILFLVGIGFSLVLEAVVPYFLGVPFFWRMVITALFLFPLGICMGMPFPLGLLLVHKRAPGFVGWVWGVNGFTTVLGSVATVIIALMFGFEVVFSIACFLYLAGTLLVGKMDGSMAG